MNSLVLAVPIMTAAWFFTFQPQGQPARRFGPYLTEGTCQAVRTRVIARARQADASACFKVIVQEREPIEE